MSKVVQFQFSLFRVVTKTVQCKMILIMNAMRVFSQIIKRSYLQGLDVCLIWCKSVRTYLQDFGCHGMKGRMDTLCKRYTTTFNLSLRQFNARWLEIHNLQYQYNNKLKLKWKHTFLAWNLTEMTTTYQLEIVNLIHD